MPPKKSVVNAGASGRQLRPSVRLSGYTHGINWACTNCGYRVEGELPEKCPDCGADKEMFDEVPVPGY